MTCDICADWSAAQSEQFVKKRSYKERRKPSRPSGSVPPAPLASSRAETPSGVSQPGTSSSSLSCPSGGQGKREGSRGAPGVVSRGASSPPAGSRSSERGGSVSGLSSVESERAPASPAPSGAGEGGVARSQRTSLARYASSVVSPHSSPHARRRGELREISEDRSRVLSSRGSRSSDRVVLVTVAVVLALAPLPVRGQEIESVEGGHRRGRSLPVCGRVEIGRGLLTATALDACGPVLRETGLDPRIDTGLAEIALGMTGRSLLTATNHVVSVRAFPSSPWRSRSSDLPRRSRDCSRSRDRRPSSPDRSRSWEKGRLARRDQQEGGETVAVSQAPAVSEASTGVTPIAGGTPLSALPSDVQDLARFFLNLSGFSSLGAVGGVAGMAASTAGSGVQLCPSTSAGGAVALGAAIAILAGAGDLPAAPAAVPGMSGLQQRQEDSRPRRRRRRSSSDGTDR